jgi:hypothetical protein
LGFGSLDPYLKWPLGIILIWFSSFVHSNVSSDPFNDNSYGFMAKEIWSTLVVLLPLEFKTLCYIHAKKAREWEWGCGWVEGM